MGRTPGGPVSRSALYRTVCLAVFLAGLGSQSALADTLRVAVAGNFLPTLERLISDFEEGAGHEVALSSGSTGKLYAQIRQGAPFQVFLAADRARPEALARDGLAIPGTRVTYAIGRLVLWAPAARPDSNPEALLVADPPPRIALANPRVAPFGAAAEAWLRARGAWERLSPRAVLGENVSQAFHFVASGNADLGLVALGQLRTLPDIEGAYRVLPGDGYPLIEQQAVLLDDTPAARAFLAWLTAPGTREALVALGYDSP
jgi:molybdate transport system substrate-binding protein